MKALNILDNIANVMRKTVIMILHLFFFRKAFDQIRPGFTETDLLRKENGELPGR